MSNAPLDFAAKVKWRMLHDRNPLLATLQDKAEVKRYALARGVASPQLLFLTTNAASLPFDSLPGTCFIKATHGCGWNFLREDGEFYFFKHGNDLLNADGTLVNEAARAPFRVSQNQVVELGQRMLGMRFGQDEWAYYQIQPRILVEEKLHAAAGGELRDYRFYTFDGVVRAVNVGSASYRKNRENVFFTPDWQVVPLTVYKEKLSDPLPERPEKLDEMIAAAQRLGAGLDFARVDLYQSTQGVMLGEMTIYPEAGLPNTPTACPQFNRWLGECWRLPGFTE